MTETAALNLRPSAAHRWRSCTAYPALEAKVQPPETRSSAADEGTRLHAHMESIVKLGRPLDGCTDRHKAILRDAWRLWGHDRLRARAHRWLPEAPVTIHLGGGAPIRGTCDAVGYDPQTRAMLIIDWKFGQRHRVHALGNPQLALYAAGAVAQYGRLVPVERIETYIVQPRVEGAMEQPPENWTMTMSDLIREVSDLMDVVKRIYADETEFLPTEDNCRWCSVKEHCSAYATAQTDRHAHELGVMRKMYANAGEILNRNLEENSHD